MIVYQKDEKRSITATPLEDITGLNVLAELYNSDGEYQGIANAVKPEPITSQVKLTLVNSSGGDADVVVTILAKMRFEDTYTQIDQETVTTTSNSISTEYTVSFDQQDYDDVQVTLTGFGANVILESSSVEKAPYTSLVGLVVGAGANVDVSVPCDFRSFEPGEYVLLFVAEGYGVIGKDVVVIQDLSDIV